MNQAQARHILPVIVLSQFCCTSLWFATNGVIGPLASHFNLAADALGHLTSFVQFGFIAGTLLFALFTLADRFAPSRVFMVCALLGAGLNAATLWGGNTLGSLLAWRFLTGFFLAGIYPVGMKIASDYYQEGLGKSLGYLVGALVVGTALPHLLRGSVGADAWKGVVLATSGLAALGGVLMWLLVPNGPFRHRGQKPDFSAFFRVFQNRSFRAAAFGYFGHMWELYAFWAFVPVLLARFGDLHPESALSVPALSFAIIAIGGPACVAGGYISQRLGPARTAGFALFGSGLCCLLSPLVYFAGNGPMLVAFLLFWGMAVVADSPLFSTLVARNAPVEARGTALTIVNCVGFAITIGSIQLLNGLHGRIDTAFLFTGLALGPLLGLLALARGRKNSLLLK